MAFQRLSWEFHTLSNGRVISPSAYKETGRGFGGPLPAGCPASWKMRKLLDDFVFARGFAIFLMGAAFRSTPQFSARAVVWIRYEWMWEASDGAMDREVIETHSLRFKNMF
jgi:hypothetical protein